MQLFAHLLKFWRILFEKQAGKAKAKCKDVEIETHVIYEKNVVNGRVAEPSVPCGVEGNVRRRQA